MTKTFTLAEVEQVIDEITGARPNGKGETEVCSVDCWRGANEVLRRLILLDAARPPKPEEWPEPLPPQPIQVFGFGPDRTAPEPRPTVGVVEYGAMLERHHATCARRYDTARDTDTCSCSEATNLIRSAMRSQPPTPEVPALVTSIADGIADLTRQLPAPPATPWDVKLMGVNSVVRGAAVSVDESKVHVLTSQGLKTVPEPTAPEVVWSGDGVRVLADGTLHRDVYDYGWRAVEDASALHGGHAMALAHALAEAKREQRCDHGQPKEYCAQSFNDAVDAAKARGAESMRERAAQAARACECAGVSSEWSAAQKAIEADIRALPLEGE